VDEKKIDEDAESGMERIMGVIDIIRNIRGEIGIPPNVKVDVLIRPGDDETLLEGYGLYIKELAKVENLTFLKERISERAAIGLYNGIEVGVLVKDLVDIPKELARIEKELARIEEESIRVMNKMQNRAFLEKAPPEVVRKNEEAYRVLQEREERLMASKRLLESI
jgi:valyl-tRNA synthetase